MTKPKNAVPYGNQNIDSYRLKSNVNCMIEQRLVFHGLHTFGS